MNKKYYAVKCKCGHVGRHNYILITYGIIAESAKEAAFIARWLPRCKHHHKDCIREVTEITIDEYIQIRLINNLDPYLNCSSRKQQKTHDVSGRVFPEEEKELENNISINKVYKGKLSIRKPKKFLIAFPKGRSQK